MSPSVDTVDTLDDRRILNRRRSARANVRWPVTIVHQEKTLHGRVKNISRGGVLVYLAEELEVHDVVRLAVEIPEYQDAITAEGEVLRTWELKNIVEKTYSYALSVQFTDISNENLKYFSGNFAPEWHQNYLEDELEAEAEPAIKQKQVSRRAGKFARPIAWGTALLCLLLLFLLIRPTDNNDEFKVIVEELNGRIDELEFQINTLKSSKKEAETLAGIESKFQGVEQKLQSVQDERAVFILKLDQLEENQKNLQTEITSATRKEQKQGTPTLSNAVPSKIKKTNSSKQLYLVKKGETLYRISINHNLTIAELRNLNGLSETDAIFPGQKLRVK